MKAGYDDILGLTKKKPLWYDDNGVPRYSKFKPDDAPSIYADQVILFKISCQNCLKEFHVSLCKDLMDRWTIHRMIREGQLGYGDPPRHACTGDTMTSVTLEILEFWTKKDGWDFVRNKSFDGRYRSWYDKEEKE